MGLLERHIVRTLVPPVAGATLFLVVVMTSFYLAQHMMEAAAEQYPLRAVFAFALLRLVIFLDVLLPVALSLGIVLGLGRLHVDLEITAMRAAGAGPARVVTAVLIPALLMAALVALVTIVLRPSAFTTLYELQARMAVQVEPGRVEPGRFLSFGSRWLVYASERRGEVLEEVLVQHRSDTDIELLQAGRLYREEVTDGLRLVFADNVQLYAFERSGAPSYIGNFDRFELLLAPPLAPERKRIRRSHSLQMLLASADPDFIAEWQWRVLAPLSTLLLALGAIPLSQVNPRQGRGASLLTGVVLVLVYFSMLGTAVHWVESETVPSWVGIWWVPASLGGVLALPLLLRTLSGLGARHAP